MGCYVNGGERKRKPGEIRRKGARKGRKKRVTEQRKRNKRKLAASPYPTLSFSCSYVLLQACLASVRAREIQIVTVKIASFGLQQKFPKG